MKRKKILTVVGARPQFIKLAMVSKALCKNFDEVIVHTGQHYDYNMSELFFEDMNIPKPDYNLGISGGSHGKMTGEMLIELEEVMKKENPDMVVLYGDTNSTMAAALAAVKLLIPVCHVEAGARLQTLTNPEEVNRIVTDHVSTLLLCCTKSAISFLEKEGKTEQNGVYLVGDPMYDAFLFYSEKVKDQLPEKVKSIKGQDVRLPKDFYYMTCHRQENTKDEKVLRTILSAMDTLESKTIYPVHPRNKNTVLEIMDDYKNIIFIEPVGYLTSVYLVNKAKKIVTDSGGIQREAFFAKKQCVTIFDFVVWPETMVNDCNQLAKADKNDILEKLNKKIVFDEEDLSFGDGKASEKIVSIIGDYFRRNEC